MKTEMAPLATTVSPVELEQLQQTPGLPVAPVRDSLFNVVVETSSLKLKKLLGLFPCVKIKGSLFEIWN